VFHAQEKRRIFDATIEPSSEESIEGLKTFEAGVADGVENTALPMTKSE
jgi:hypothetical protein